MSEQSLHPTPTTSSTLMSGIPEEQDVSDLDASVDFVNSLSEAAVKNAKDTIASLQSFSGTIAQARDELMSNKVHPIITDPDRLNAPLIHQSDTLIATDEGAREELAAARQDHSDISDDIILEDPVEAGPHDWALEDPTFSGEDPYEVLEPQEILPIAPHHLTTVDPPMSAPIETEISSDWENTLTGHLGTLYDGMTKGINQVLADNHEIKAMLAQHQSDVRMMKDEQVRLFSTLSDIKAQLTAMQGVQTAIQYDLVEMKEELSICTAGFSKINSALLQMNSLSVPMGKLPVGSGYKTSAPTLTNDQILEGKTTPIAYGDAQLTENLIKIGFPTGKVPLIRALLNNRTVKSFSCLLPQMNSNATVSHEAAKMLIEMPFIQNKEELLKACKCVTALLEYKEVMPGPSSASSSHPTDPQNIAVAAPVLKSTRIKKSNNPFAK